ncbi:MAG: 5'/3'-nucleotidase SurE [Bacteroidota bacterium]
MKKEIKSKPLILVSNDDGVYAKGLQSLIEIVSEYGEIVVVAPEKGESGMSHAITINNPLRIKTIKESDSLKIYSSNGTPVDCIKLGLNQILNRKPDFLISGINHGSNASISVIYSGTMGAAIEGCFNEIPSVGLSLLNHRLDADFTMAKFYSKQILDNFIKNQTPIGTCLNVNFPDIPINEVKGIKVCRMARGVWKEEYDKRIDPHNSEYYWLTGNFKNYEPEATDTDEWALGNNYIAIVPIHTDLTAYKSINNFKNWKYNTTMFVKQKKG